VVARVVERLGLGLAGPIFGVSNREQTTRACSALINQVEGMAASEKKLRFSLRTGTYAQSRGVAQSRQDFVRVDNRSPSAGHRAVQQLHAERHSGGAATLLSEYFNELAEVSPSMTGDSDPLRRQAALSNFNVVLLALNGSPHQRHERELASFGFRVQVCDGFPDLYRTMQRRHYTLVALLAPLPITSVAVAHLRAIDEGVGIVAITESADSESRIGALLCGADACVDAATNTLELAAILLAVGRRQRKGAGSSVEAIADEDNPSPDHTEPPVKISHPTEREIDKQVIGQSHSWRLTDHGWTLENPSGELLPLTASEREFVRGLMSAPNGLLTREEALSHNPELIGGRSLDVMISRLRRKAAAKGMDLPIRSVRGCGYLFSSNNNKGTGEKQK
jgi:two-component system OmpR family response regulator